MEPDHAELDSPLELSPVPEITLSVLADDHHHGVLVRILGALGEMNLAYFAPLDPIGHVSPHHCDLSLASKLLLHQVLHILDMHERGVPRPHTLRHSVGDAGSWLGILAQIQEGLAHRGLNLGLAPGHHVSIASNQAHRHGVQFPFHHDLAVLLETPREDQRLGDIVRIVLDQRLLDEHIEIVLAQLDRAPAVHLLHETLGHIEGHRSDEAAILIIVDALLQFASGKKEVGEGFPNRVGDIREQKLPLPARTSDDDLRNWIAIFGGQRLAPIVTFTARVRPVAVRDDLFQRNVFLKRDGSIHDGFAE